MRGQDNRNGNGVAGMRDSLRSDVQTGFVWESLEARTLLSSVGATDGSELYLESGSASVATGELQGVGSSPAVSAAATSDLRIGEWSWSLPSSESGTASVNAQVHNDSLSGYSGSLGLSLWLSTQPFGQAGSYYTVAEYLGLDQLTAGYWADYWASDGFSLASVPDGTYYVVSVLSEFTGFEYTIVDGVTDGQNLYTITTTVPVPPLVVPIVPDLAPPEALLTGKTLRTRGKLHKFTVRYFDPGGLQLNDIDTYDITYTDPFGGTYSPQMLKVKANRRGTRCTVTYFIPAPAGKWYSSDNGTYTITLGGGAVRDLSGNGVVGGYWTFVVQSRKVNPFVLVAQGRLQEGIAPAGVSSVAEEILILSSAADPAAVLLT